MTADSQARARRPLLDVFVGRHEELDALQGGLTDAFDGRGRLFLLSGEPGIGKTRLAEELARHAHARGAGVLWGRCWEGEGAPGFWPWIEVVRAYAHHVAGVSIPQGLGPGVEDIARLVPELRQRGAGEADVVLLEDAHARFRLFDAFAMFLREAARQQALLVIIDDVQWADLASLQLLQFIAREITNDRVLILTTLRSTQADAASARTDALEALLRAGHNIAVPELRKNEVAELVRAVTGAPPTAELVVSLHRQTAGNPYFLREMLAAGLDALATGSDRVPLSVRASIRGRLRQLSPACKRLLGVAAVMGSEFSAPIVRLVREREQHIEDVFDLLREAEAAGVVRGAEGAGQYRFPHALVRAAVYDDLPAAERARIHLAVAETLAQLSPAVVAERLAEIAHHFFAAAPAHGVDQAIAYAKRAGDHACAQLAYEAAAQRYATALQALEWKEQSARADPGGPRPPAGALQRGEIVLAMGEARRLAGQAAGAREAFLETVQLARVAGDPELLARAAIGLAGGPDVSTRGDAEALALLEEAYSALDLPDSPLTAKLQSKLGVALCFAGDRDRGVALSARAIEVAERVGDGPTLAFTLNARRYALMGPDHAAHRRSVTPRIFRLAQELQSQELTSAGDFWRLLDLIEDGDGVGFDGVLEHFTQLADALRQPFLVWRSRVLRAMRSLLVGRFDDAERQIPDALSLGQRAQTQNAELVYGLQLLVLRTQQGRLDEVRPILHGVESLYPSVPAVRCGMALVSYHLGGVADARATLAQLGVHDFAELPRESGWLGAIAALSEIAAALGDVDRAAILYRQLLPHAGQSIVIGFGDLCQGSVARPLGVLAAALSRWDDAQGHYEAAIAAHTRLGARPFLAHTWRQYAEMLLARGAPGDRPRAQDLLAEAITTYADLGMEGFRQQAVAAQQAGPQAPPRPRSEGAPTEPAAANAFRKRGEYWELGYAGEMVRLRDRKGLRYLLPLLREPGREFHVADLLMLTQGERRSLTRGSDPDLAVPDARAKAEYQRRLAELRDAEVTAERCNDSLRATASREQIALLTAELSRCYGFALGGARSRNAAVERMRKRVANSVHNALVKVQESHPFLWRHLFASLKMGTFCSYNPERRTSWITSDS